MGIQPSTPLLTWLAAEHEFVDPASPPVKHIVGQALFQLAVMYGLVFHPELLGVPDHATLAGAPSEHYTIVFNAFVLMQASAACFRGSSGFRLGTVPSLPLLRLALCTATASTGWPAGWLAGWVTQ